MEKAVLSHAHIHTHMHTYTHTRLTALFPGLPRWAGTRKVKPIWDFTEARDSEWQVCISLQTDNHASKWLRYCGWLVKLDILSVKVAIFIDTEMNPAAIASGETTAGKVQMWRVQAAVLCKCWEFHRVGDRTTKKEGVSTVKAWLNHCIVICNMRSVEEWFSKKLHGRMCDVECVTWTMES